MARLNLVSLERLRPTVLFDLRYATPNNITGKVLAEGATIARLDMGAATRLSKVAAELIEDGYKMVLWDAFRSEEVQRELRVIDADAKYVLEESQHSLGLAVDVTLADKDGNLLDMGTDHDEFSDWAHDGAAGLTENQEANRYLLKITMARHGFTVWPYEWWHFDFDPANIKPY